MNGNTQDDMHGNAQDSAQDNMHGIDPVEWQAYLDNEADADTRARIEAAIAADPELAARLARDRRLQARVRDAFSDALDDPVPAHLLELVASAPAKQAAGARASDEAANVVALPPRSRQRRLPPAWLGYAMAAALAVVAIGGAWQRTQSPVRLDDGELVAGGALARGLDNALTSAPDAASKVSIGLSFRSRDGRACRSFSYRGDGALSGLACRSDGAWRLSALERIETEVGGEWRQASSAMTPAVQAAVDAALAGGAFDAEQERAARARGWR